MIQSFSFWAFLAAAVPIYWLCPEGFRNRFLALASYLFLAWSFPASVAGMTVVALVVYAIARLALKNPTKLTFYGSLAVILAYLFYFKYFAEVADMAGLRGFEAIALPIGISYFSFKLIHFIIEVNRRTIRAFTPGDYANFLFLMPIFTSGPITRFDNMAHNRDTRFSTELATEGLTRIAYGLIKKMIVVAAITALLTRITPGYTVAAMLENLGAVPAYKVWMVLILTYMFVYFDFSAYSDIAIGASRLFGFRIIENFNFPFLAPNIGNLWKRWHISLSNWCQTYIYLPTIGATRNPYLSVFVSFTVMGLWHAASWNFVLWGWYNALGIVVFQYWSQFKRRRKIKWGDTGPASYGKYVLTNLYFCGAFAFTMTDGHGTAWDAIRVLARAFAVTLPAL